jgi:NhaP-type Na+/H+ or K+/H+ antiporter
LLAADPGFSLGDAWAGALLFAGAALFVAVASLSQQHERAFSAAIIYLFLGAAAAAAVDAFGSRPIDPFDDAELIERAAELALIVALFSAGLKIDRPLGWHRWRSPAALLLLVMPLTIAVVALLGSALLGLSLGAALILAAVLAPTDPVLASEVGVGPPGEEDEPEPDFALTAEAGFNDGLAFPFVLLGIFIVDEGGTGWLPEWLAADVVYAIAVGVAAGVLLGRSVAAAFLRLRERGWLMKELDGFLAIATVLAVYGAVELIGGYGFLAAFTGGLAFRRYEHDHEYNATVHAGAGAVEKITELTLILLLGSTITLTGLGEPGVEGWILAIALILVIRPLLTLLAFAPVDIPMHERVFVAWFGVRGVGSFYYAAIALGAGVLAADDAAAIYWTVVVCVGLSIVAHGVTASPLSGWMGARSGRG